MCNSLLISYGRFPFPQKAQGPRNITAPSSDSEIHPAARSAYRLQNAFHSRLHPPVHIMYPASLSHTAAPSQFQNIPAREPSAPPILAPVSDVTGPPRAPIAAPTAPPTEAPVLPPSAMLAHLSRNSDICFSSFDSMKHVVPERLPRRYASAHHNVHQPAVSTVSPSSPPDQISFLSRIPSSSLIPRTRAAEKLSPLFLASRSSHWGIVTDFLT